MARNPRLKLKREVAASYKTAVKFHKRLKASNLYIKRLPCMKRLEISNRSLKFLTQSPSEIYRRRIIDVAITMAAILPAAGNGLKPVEAAKLTALCARKATYKSDIIGEAISMKSKRTVRKS